MRRVKEFWDCAGLKSMSSSLPMVRRPRTARLPGGWQALLPP